MRLSKRAQRRKEKHKKWLTDTQNSFSVIKFINTRMITFLKRIFLDFGIKFDYTGWKRIESGFSWWTLSLISNRGKSVTKCLEIWRNFFFWGKDGWIVTITAYTSIMSLKRIKSVWAFSDNSSLDFWSFHRLFY